MKNKTHENNSPPSSYQLPVFVPKSSQQFLNLFSIWTPNWTLNLAQSSLNDLSLSLLNMITSNSTKLFLTLITQTLVIHRVAFKSVWSFEFINFSSLISQLNPIVQPQIVFKSRRAYFFERKIQSWQPIASLWIANLIAPALVHPEFAGSQSKYPWSAFKRDSSL